MKDEVIMNVILQTLLNKDVANAKTTSDKKVKDVMEDQLHQFTALYKMYVTNSEFKNFLNSYVFQTIMDTLNKKAA